MSILYCGDTDLSGAASYLAGLLSLWGWDYDYVPSHVPLTREHIEQPRKLIIFSDYPGAMLSEELQQLTAAKVSDGTGLLMIGGWESFRGLDGRWHGTAVGGLLPVTIGSRDDRMNFYQPTLLTGKSSGICKGLPWDELPPTIGGMNRVTAKPRSRTLLLAQKYLAYEWYGAVRFKKQAEYEALVIGTAGKGRTAAFMPDVAPHWVGGFVDWGDSRVKAQAPGAPAIEVGNWYAQFWRQLLSWTGRLS